MKVGFEPILEVPLQFQYFEGHWLSESYQQYQHTFLHVNLIDLNSSELRHLRLTLHLEVGIPPQRLQVSVQLSTARRLAR